ncbi:MAG: tetratricopeptide repeat protein [Gammaproteobacteria bacterium]|nr:tetratricopeptide repeat protein [Gammaproteobacteria bacterium]MCW5583268.1 tetratricopeptide repeat protein [Gammaproteobacteria bacterium]
MESRKQKTFISISNSSHHINNHSYEYLDRGVIAEKAGNYYDAISNYTRAIELDPTNSYAYTNIGAIYHMQKKISLATLYYNKALRINPSDTAATDNLTLLHSSKNPLKPTINPDTLNPTTQDIATPSNVTTLFYLKNILPKINWETSLFKLHKKETPHATSVDERIKATSAIEMHNTL